MDGQQSASADIYDYDAPSFKMDIESLVNDGSADLWFDQKPDKTGSLLTPLKTLKPLGGTSKAGIPRAVVSPRRKSDHSSAELNTEDEEPAPSTSALPSNIVTSWGTNTTNMAKQAQKKAMQPRRVSKRREMAEREERRKNAAVPSTPPVKKQRRSSSSHHQRRSISSQASKQKSPQTATLPARERSTVPAGLKKMATVKHKSSEDQELEHIEALQKETAKQRRKNEASFKAAMAGSHPPKKPALTTTVPLDFKFRTDDRLKATETHADGAYKEVDFATQLRKHPSSPLKAHRGATVPKPFNLSTGTKRKFEEVMPYVPMAQQIEQFQKRTPTRYHLRSKQRDEKGPTPAKTEKLKVTNPCTPQLRTKQRHRPVTVKSSAEVEAEEMEKLQQFKFKALELNRKILESALVPKKPAPKEVTHPEGFQLEMERRVQERQAARKPEEVPDYTFHSRPLPTKILEDVVGVPEKKTHNPTVPESPAFALKNRVRLERKVEEVKPAPTVRANPMPHFGLPFQPKLTEMRNVEVCPFSFDAREKERQALKERRLEELRQEEVPKFKAQPLPDFHEVHLPEKKVTVPTKMEPFKLLADERGIVKSERWEQMVKEELKHQAEASSFKARPNTVVYKEPFVPKKENRSILEALSHSVVPEGFQLSTERRAKERHEFDQAVSEKDAHRARVEAEEQRRREEQEKEDIARLRQEQVHKAQPIRRYRPMEVKRSEVALTVPHSPNFSERFRL